MRLALRCCFRGEPDSPPRTPRPPEAPALGTPALDGAAALQDVCSSLPAQQQGSLPVRAAALVAALRAHAVVTHARLYGVTNEGNLVPITSGNDDGSAAAAAAGASPPTLATEPQTEAAADTAAAEGDDGHAELRASLFQQACERMAPVVQRIQEAPLLRAALVPLLQGCRVLGALWIVLRTPPTPNELSALGALGFAASCMLCQQERSFQAIADVLARLYAASMRDLVVALCSALEAHVSRQFVLDSTAWAALAPCCEPSGPDQQHSHHQQQHCVLLLPSAGGRGQPPTHEASGAAHPMGTTLLGSAQPTVGVRLRDLLAASAGEPWSPLRSRSLSSINIFAERFGSTSRPPATTNDPTGQAATAGTDAGGCSAGTSAANGLHARAYPLRHTLLSAALAQRREQQRRQRQQTLQGEGTLQPAAAAGVARAGADARTTAAGARTPLRPASAPSVAGVGACKPAPVCVEDVALYVQDVHAPSNDVAMLLSLGRGKTKTKSSSSDNAGSPGPCGMAAAPRSLALLTLLLPHQGAALAFYMCFPDRLPPALLEAVRVSCQELLDTVLVAPVASKLRADLAAEYGTLTAGVPGSYAVLRGTDGGARGDDSDKELPLPYGLFASCGGKPRCSTRHGGGSGGGRFSLDVPLSHSGPQGGVAAGLLAAAIQDTMPSPREAKARTNTASGVFANDGASATRTALPATAGTKAAGGVSPALSILRRAMQSSCRLGGGYGAHGSAHTGSTHTGEPQHVRGSGSGIDEDATTAPATMLAPPSVPASACTPRAARGGPHDLAPERSASRKQVPIHNEHLLDMLMSSGAADASAYDATLGCPASTLGRSLATDEAAFITVTAPEPAHTAAREQLQVLVDSIKSGAHVTSSSVVFPEDLKALEIGDVVARGGSGIVFRGLMSGVVEVAVKVMELPAADDLQLGSDSAAAGILTDTVDDAAAGAVAAAADDGTAARRRLKARRTLLRNATEVVLQARISSPHIVQVYSAWPTAYLLPRRSAGGSGSQEPPQVQLTLTQPPPSEGAACCTVMVFEWCDGGSLGDVLRTNAFPRLTVNTAQFFRGQCMYDMQGVYMTLLDVAMALRHLHAMHLVHRDIKPANLLLKTNPRDYRKFSVKLADFGFVMRLDQVAEDGTRFAIADQACGTVTHMAPEALISGRRLDASVDVYSFGVLMWEIFAGGNRPYAQLHPDRIPAAVYAGLRPVFSTTWNLPAKYRDLAHACWARTPVSRPSAADLVSTLTSWLQLAMA